MASLSLSRFSLGFSGLRSPSTQKATNGLNMFTRVFPKPSKRRMDLITSKAALIIDQSTQRRRNNHHPNLWEDDFINSLPKAYDAPCYVEQAENLIKEVKEMFNGMLTQNFSVHDCLSMVDNVERLGIDRHFQKEIDETLDYVYRHWSDKGIENGGGDSWADLNITALALRILRLHRYDVSAGVLENFKAKDGKFLSLHNQSDREIEAVLNLFRASLIGFHGEKVLEEAKAFAITYLTQVLSKTDGSNLSREIEYNLDYRWHTNVPRLETWNYIDIYGAENSWMTCESKKKVLDLAKLDFNMVQSVQQRELQILAKWWKDSGVRQLTFARNRYVEFYFWVAGGSVEPKDSSFRISFAKIASLATVIDDIYDTYGTLEELQLFTNAMERWDPSSIGDLPEYMKIVFIMFCNMVDEITQEIIKTQGRDTIDYARIIWNQFINSYFQEAKWLAAGYIPTFKEYIKNSKISGGARILIMQPILTLEIIIPKKLLPRFDFPSRFLDIMGYTFRLSNDINTFKVEATRGEEVSSVRCYMRENPNSTEEEALDYLNSFQDDLLKELLWEYLKKDGVPTYSKDHAVSLSRGIQLFYKEGDGFSLATKDIKGLIWKILVQPIVM